MVVIEIGTASKIAALNAAAAAASTPPVAYVDADVIGHRCDAARIDARLGESSAGAGGRPALIVLPSVSWWVRQYYRVWALTDYRAAGHIGSGIYLLSPEGRRRFGQFPDVIADDLFVQRLFADHERLTPADLTFAVRAPATLVGTQPARHPDRRRQPAARGRVSPTWRPRAGIGARSTARSRVARHPDLWVGVRRVQRGLRRSPVVRANAHRGPERPIAWNRDETTRTGRR